MYLSFYKLKKMPFQVTVDPEFLWLGEKHKEALATLKYGILENKGFLLLTGEVGVGKTVLINHLVDLVQIETIVTTIPDPDLDSLDFFHFLADGFNMDNNFGTKSEFLIALRNFLYASYSKDQKVLLIIDEAQRLSRERLEEIRLLSNIELNHSKLINIFFVGQSEFNDTLADKRCRSVRQRITVNYNIEPLGKLETRQFIEHRLKVAGAEQPLFTRMAIKEIFVFSGGTPRLINIICDHALLTGYAREIKKIGPDIIRECADDLKIPVSNQGIVKKQPIDESGHVTPDPLKQTERMATNETVIAADAPTPVKQFPFKGTLIAGVLFILIVSVGFFLYIGMGSTNAPKWSADQLTPKKYQETLQQEKEDLADQISGMKKLQTPQPQVDAKVTPSKPALEKTRPAETPPPAPAHAVETVVPAAARKVDPEKTITISFANNSNDLPPDAIPQLDAIAAFLSNNPNYRIEIRGYTDSTGAPVYNENISRFRASTIKSYLAGRGADPAIMVSAGLGQKDNIASNDTIEGRQQNRRVEIEFFTNKKDR